ncbi:TetR/AcrR family transcriptional regulator [Streptomyces sp. PKU-EA00015]|uniref:TetR family transcriptional regulator n=1 Tax=Streptomyces sp. PKU-EA00015 TaxID=2748326 RepID=UPI0015A0C8D1|nr:TetR/AcrR family transcriptional regulator [Streptomyces sp. PKU-EA00015]NWF27868.1 TetR/AcrR family transcriptional regulator [Streptomyces sp. PKU-EA00015]
MSPRGVAVPNARERLFAAAERVVAAAGPGALTSRAITDEAGCSKGLLHAHFAGGLDEFVAELVLDRFARTAALAADLPAHAGTDTVAANLTGVASALLTATGPVVSGLALTRPGAAERFRDAMASGAPGFAAIQESVTRYLDAERSLGRVPADLDTAAAALALVGTVHHLLMTTWPGAPDPREQVERLVALLTRT